MSQQNFLCQVVNLDRNPERLSSISAQLHAIGIGFTRFSAVNGASLSNIPPEVLNRAAYRKQHGKEVAPGEIGCFLSHLGLMQAFLKTHHSHCLVLEDDALLPPDLKKIIEDLIQIQDGWDLVMLCGAHSAQPVVTASLRSGRDLVGYFGKQTSTVAYILNRKAAQAYTENLLPMSLPIDHALGRVWEFGIRIRGVKPLPIGYGDFESDIKTNPKLKWQARLTTHAFRLGSDLRRIAYHLLRDPIWLEALRRRWR